ncbi:MAG TPA: NAD-dependent epimerase/dehydratase family protein [Bacteroidales bacterium]|jgi:nucleoside-diphosphate-sugar epimerase|nr:NAD-dependent epimerase/dehydratase family protein [Bacteroidales bacterium]HOS71709.1 NAD-dependent epimerase/dehydratase family protein [Bacteroidales bacterium]HQH25089.1 NAD-dependent epimerase/dehydratase family protein [Bacteroidales bacterium]HQJ82711.1 NAD-dependent epimerase/dehydratase family protein [Bacteroidales bacterium]
MKVLITGSSGSLARMLIGHLAEKNTEIVGIDIRECSDSLHGDKFRFYKCSITEKEKLISIFAGEKPTNVVHFACSFNKVRNRKQEYEIDITGSDNVLKASQITPSVRQLIYISSAAAYGGKKNNPLWMSESEPLDPGKYRYGMNKKLVEHNYTNIKVRDDLRIVILRPCQVLGPAFDKPKSIVSILIKVPFLPKFTRETKLQFIHSVDLVALMELILKDNEISGIYNLVPDSYSTVKDIVPDKKFLPVPFFVIKGFLWICWHLKIMNIQPASIVHSFYPTIVDSTKLTSRYGYKFKYSSKEAFEDTVVYNRIPEGSWL